MEVTEIIKDDATKLKENLDVEPEKAENSINNVNDKEENNVAKKENDAGKVEENIHPDIVDKIENSIADVNEKKKEEKIEKKLTAKEKRKLWVANKRKLQKLSRKKQREEKRLRQNENKNINLPRPLVEEEKQKQETCDEQLEKIHDNNNKIKEASQIEDEKIDKKNKSVVDLTEEKKLDDIPQSASKFVQKDELMIIDEDVEGHEKDQDNVSVLGEEKNPVMSETMQLVASTEEKSAKVDKDLLIKPHQKEIELNKNNQLSLMIDSTENQLVPLVKNPKISSMPSLADIPLTNPESMSFINMPLLKLRSKNAQSKSPAKFNWSDEDGAVGFDNPWKCEQQPDDPMIYEEEEEEGDRSLEQERRERRKQVNRELEDCYVNFLIPQLVYSNQQMELNEEKELQLALEMSHKSNNNWPIVKSEVYVNKNLNTGEKNEFTELMLLEEIDLVPNTYEFKCPICLEFIGSNQGIVLHGCSHKFCR